MRTIGDRVVETGGRTTGFDYLRVGLAAAVVLWHTFPVSYGIGAEEVLTLWPRPVIAIILPAFFALSGFLVAGSLERNTSLIRFAALRALRIIPALGVEVTLSALILGPLVTNWPLKAYFSDAMFFRYFQNIAGRIHYALPGAFAGNPIVGIVNGQLWTIPFELECYAVLMIIAALGFVRVRWLMLAAVAGFNLVLVGGAIVPVLFGGEPLPHLGGIFTGRLLVAAFLWGVTLFRFRDRVPLTGALGVAAAVLSVGLLEMPLGDYLAPLPIAYVVAWAGLQNPRANVIVKFGDFSYGVFLYGFAVQQVVASLGTWTHHWYVNAVLVFPILTLFAAFSWYSVERPALSLRKHLALLDPLDASIERARHRAWTAAALALRPNHAG